MGAGSWVFTFGVISVVCGGVKEISRLLLGDEGSVMSRAVPWQTLAQGVIEQGSPVVTGSLNTQIIT